MISESKKAFAVALFVLIAVSVPCKSAKAERPGNFGIGLGEGTLASGLSGKVVSGTSAFQANVGSVRGRGFGHHYKYGGLGLSLDALVVGGTIASGEVLSLDWSAGVGGGLGFVHDHVAAAAALVAGLEFNFRPIPLDITLEARPNILIVPDVDFDFDITAHIRVWFN